VVIEGVFTVGCAVLAIVEALFDEHSFFSRDNVHGKALTWKLVSFSAKSSSGTTLGPSTNTTPPLAGAAGAGLGVQYKRVVPSVA
jgi:hypothetical protein